MDGRTWRTVSLSDDITEIRHVATVPDGVLSVVRQRGSGNGEVLFTPFVSPEEDQGK